MHSFLTLSFYYWIITFSILGFGLLFNQIFLKSSEKNIGYLGIYGIFVLILISYVSSFFIPHSELFNSILILIGLINLIVNRGEIVVNKNIKNLIIIFLIFNIFILVSKNHDDFSYYHFPYTHLLTEYSNMIGLGNFNHGFRTHSSIFYLSSLFNLPFSDLYLLHLSPVYFIGFANLIFYNRIFLSLKSKEKSFILYLSLLSLIFINIFFYRLADLHLTMDDTSLFGESFMPIFLIVQIPTRSKPLAQRWSDQSAHPEGGSTSATTIRSDPCSNQLIVPLTGVEPVSNP